MLEISKHISRSALFIRKRLEMACHFYSNPISASEQIFFSCRVRLLEFAHLPSITRKKWRTANRNIYRPIWWCKTRIKVYVAEGGGQNVVPDNIFSHK